MHSTTFWSSIFFDFFSLEFEGFVVEFAILQRFQELLADTLESSFERALQRNGF